MVKRSHGFRVGTRRKLSKHPRDRGKISLRNMFQKLEIGDKVVIKPEPAIHKGLPFSRFFNKEGKVVDKRGSAYLVQIKEGNRLKKVICNPVHIKKI